MFAPESKPLHQNGTLFIYPIYLIKRRGVCYILSVADVETHL